MLMFATTPGGHQDEEGGTSYGDDQYRQPEPPDRASPHEHEQSADGTEQKPSGDGEKRASWQRVLPPRSLWKTGLSVPHGRQLPYA